MTSLRAPIAVVGVLAVFALGTAACGADPASVGGATTGEAVYRQQCSTCHGMDRKGIGSTPALDPAKVQALGVEGVKSVVVNGKNTMVGFGSKLTPAQVDAVASYLVNG